MVERCDEGRRRTRATEKRPPVVVEVREHGGYLDGIAADIAQAGATKEPDVKRPRLLSLELSCGAPLAEMRAFYGKTLDLGILEERHDRLTIGAGETRLTFVQSSENVDGRPPFYHFAFNIPENKIVQALEWQKARTPMLPIPERNRAAGFPPEVVDYSHWNAHSIFFLGGYAIHGTNAVGKLGRPVSHGCVRLAPGNAAKLFAMVQKYGRGNTRIVVTR